MTEPLSLGWDPAPLRLARADQHVKSLDCFA